jgi:hypothetical protein
MIISKHAKLKEFPFKMLEGLACTNFSDRGMYRTKTKCLLIIICPVKELHPTNGELHIICILF